MTSDPKASNEPDLALRLRAGHIRYGANWQGTAIKTQYKRLASNMQVDPEQPVLESLRLHMQALVDLDFLITSIRRLLRVAEQARRLGLDQDRKLKLAIRIFNSRWQPYLVDIRNTLEHVDQPGFPFVPFRGGGKVAFSVPGGEIDATKLYDAAMELYKAICRAIAPFESSAPGGPAGGSPPDVSDAH
jgi:hypothetical protein